MSYYFIFIDKLLDMDIEHALVRQAISLSRSLSLTFSLWLFFSLSIS